MRELPVPQPGDKSGGIYSIGYNAWKGDDGLSRMYEALGSEGVTIIVDTRNSDFRAKYSFDKLADESIQRQMLYTSRPALAGKPREDAEFAEAGQADYSVMDKREDATQMLDGITKAAQKGDRIALLCSCADLHTCHRSRWLSKSLAGRGVDVGHIEPGEYNPERDKEQGERELYSVTPHSELPELPDHSQIDYRKRAEYWKNRNKPQPVPEDYQSPQAARELPESPSQILIAGSMRTNNAQLNYASALVVRAAETGAQIHVGDNDQGVDARVVETAKSIGYEDVVVWTAGDDPRNGGVPGGEVRKVPHNYKEKGNRFSQRDRAMIRSLDDERGAVFFIDNGHTHYKNGRLTGTEAGYTFAIEEGKATRKVSFGRKQDREAELDPLPTGYKPEPAIDAEPDDGAAPPPASESPSKRYPTLQEFEENLRSEKRSEQAPPPPESSEPEPLYAFSIQTLRVKGEDGRPARYAAVAIRDVYEQGILEGDPDERYSMELGWFEKKAGAEKYAAAVTEYIEENDGLALSGSAEETLGTQAFLGGIAEENNLPVVAVSDEYVILDQSQAHNNISYTTEGSPSIEF